MARGRGAWEGEGLLLLLLGTERWRPRRGEANAPAPARGPPAAPRGRSAGELAQAGVHQAAGLGGLGRAAVDALRQAGGTAKSVLAACHARLAARALKRPASGQQRAGKPDDPATNSSPQAAPALAAPGAAPAPARAHA